MGRPGTPDKGRAARAGAPGRESAEPAAGAGPAETPAADAGRATSDRGAAWRFTLKAAATTVGGAILTLCITAAQISYTKYLEVLERQGEQGMALQQQMLQTTGHIENEIIAVYNVLHNDFNGTPPADLTAGLNRLNQQWRLDRLSLRIRGAQIYGSGVGNRIYDPREESIDLDTCGVETAAGAPGANENCAARQRAEASRLGALVARLKADRSAGRDVRLTPNSFQANFRLTRKVLDAYLACWGHRLDGSVAAARRCEARSAILQVLSARIDLLVLARETLSTEIMRRSALSD
jgi:hypothetical protein